ncbi:MAG: single-stranded-DNA-specific exonuclease RecJ [Gammaproteobacteria bacterium RIFCSPLOWO2_12_47_11]|nr:MAG: single-stranded-DNA-specific exonuclease RecJ [Gammaproteobacteria bacterium RIFCSPLOWO2_12_47_11]
MPVNITRRTSLNDVSFPEDIHPVLRRIYAARNIQSAMELDYSLQGLLPFEALLGIDKAVTLLANALRENKKILIVADFDADGATSCALALRGLKLMGFSDVLYVVPNRFEFGYGLSPEIVEVAAEMQPDVIITVDNGISSIEGVAQARSRNIDVLITDHHLPGLSLPDANAIVNPNQPGDSFPSKNLAGVGVMFYILIALRSHLREQNWFAANNIPEPNLAELLDLVALGTVADVVPLDHNNRILVAQGLARIRSGKCCPGIRELLQAANRNLRNTAAQDLSFAVAPRLNAAGRLTDMSLGIECLLTDDQRLAKDMALKLEQLNKERREIQAEMQAQAMIDIADLDLNNQASLPNGVCLFNENWHQGVVGILAGRIKDQINRPAIVFAKDKEGYIKGSARSISSVHIRDVLDTIASQHPGIISKFGGHAMAAGLTIRESDLEQFKVVFDQITGMFLSGDELEGVLVSDGELSVNELSFDLAEKIISSGPWGQGFPEPVFDGEFEIINARVVGERHLKLQLRHPGNNRSIDAIAFNITDEDWPEATGRVQTVYKLDINEFAGRRQLQLVVDYISPVE